MALLKRNNNARAYILWFKSEQWKPVKTTEGWLRSENGQAIKKKKERKKERFAVVYTHTSREAPYVTVLIVMPQEAFVQIYSFSQVIWRNQTSLWVFFGSYLNSLDPFLTKTWSVKHSQLAQSTRLRCLIPMPALRSLQQEHGAIQFILGYIKSSRPAWAT